MANKEKTVVVSALDGTFERKPFGNIINLIPLAEKVSKLCAVCVYCTNEAAFTKRIVESKQVELIGGAEMYKPVCRACFFKEQESKKRLAEAQSVDLCQQPTTVCIVEGQVECLGGLVAA
jgi:thymidine kinase